MNTPKPHHQRGTAILTVVILTGILAFLVAALMTYAGNRRVRAAEVSRKVNRLACAEAGLELAKNYYGRNFGSWNTYLNNPAQYNPNTYTAWMGYPGGPAPFDTPALQALRPELFGDIDGDGKPDVYIYIRDNADELTPAPNNFASDNDQNVFVGAICISTTMNPRRQDGTISKSPLGVEGLLSYNLQSQYTGQAGGGSMGNGNLNN